MILDLDRTASGRSELEIAGPVDLGLGSEQPRDVVVRGLATVDNLEHRVLLAGTLQARGRAECSRCLDTFELVWDVPLEIMVLRDVDSDEADGDTLVLLQNSGEVDLRAAVTESVVLALPLAPVCREDCRGLCPSCGSNRNTDTCNCEEEDYDPRWEGLP